MMYSEQFSDMAWLSFSWICKVNLSMQMASPRESPPVLRRFIRGWEIGKTGGFSGKIIHKIWMCQATEGYS